MQTVDELSRQSFLCFIETEWAVKRDSLDCVGYKVPSIAREIIQANITPLMPYICFKGRKYKEDETRIVRKAFVYDAQHDVY